MQSKSHDTHSLMPSALAVHTPHKRRKSKEESSSKPDSKEYDDKNQNMQPMYGRQPMQPMHGRPMYGQPQMMPPQAPMMQGWGPSMGVSALMPLANLDKIYIQQNMDMIEFFVPYEKKNSYKIFSGNNQLYIALEKSDILSRQFLGSNRGFTIDVVDMYGRYIFSVDRQFQCCEDCLYNGYVVCRMFDGAHIAKIEQRFACCSSKHEIINAENETVLVMESSTAACCASGCGRCCQHTFTLKNANTGQEEGRIVKEASMNNFVSDADNYVVECSRDLDVMLKAGLIGAAFLIDYQYFEQGPVEPKQHVGMN